MRNFSGAKVLVVGASGAIGSQLSRHFLALGSEVLGTTSSNERATSLDPAIQQKLLLDLESKESLETFSNYLLATCEHLDGIVLAAGLVAFGGLEATPEAVTRRLLEVNFVGQASLVTRLQPLLAKSSSLGRKPFVLSISGVISEAPMPGLASYSASKTALSGFAIAAAKELRKAGIDWVDARPGHTETGLATRAIFGTAPNFGTGLRTEFVAERIVQGLINEEKDLPSGSFRE